MPQLFESDSKNKMVGAWIEGKNVFVVSEKKRTFIEVQVKFAILQHLAILISENGQKNLVANLFFEWIPVDVEKWPKC